MSRAPSGLEVAILGMAGRFPRAGSPEALWQAIVAGRELIADLAAEELAAAGLGAAETSKPGYVRRRAWLEDAALFDPRFFGLTPREAALIDPQQRLFLLVAAEALERAGYGAPQGRGRVGVFAGCSMSTYLLWNLLPHPGVMAEASPFELMLANDKDYLATRTSYKLDLKGPSVAVGTACSTSLVAVHLACQSLLAGDCDLALAGGASVSFPQQRGYQYQQGGIFSPDGHCRPFEARGEGTVNGDGVAAVVLKRLEDALSDGDPIHAVILGSGLNNDGADKAGFTAPSAEGQAAAIGAAQAMAGIGAGSIGYVEAHGTATPLGDPIELAALTEAFRVSTERRGFCALGSLKANLGHLDAAAGVAGLIKAALALEHATLPGSPGFERPNPALELADSPFYVPPEARPWPAGEEPRRAAVSSFGIGGTNAHAVLEEAPPPAWESSAGRGRNLLLLSARTPAALDEALARWASRLSEPGLDIADACFTAHAGRRAFEERAALLGENALEMAAALASRDPARLLRGRAEGAGRPVCFLFPGQGAQYPGMAAALFAGEPIFRAELERAFAALEGELDGDPRALLFPPDMASPAAAERLRQTAHAQPLLFAVEVALARQWLAWGVEPVAMLGHSVGEYSAACLAGVFTFEEGLRLLAQRGRLVQALPAGAMLSVPLAAGELAGRLGGDLEIATLNAPALTVVGGPEPAVEALRAGLLAEGIETRRLHTSHAFHTALLEPALPAFRAAFAGLDLKPPSRPFLSNLTGRPIRAEEATDPGYWVEHLRRPVRFADGAAALLAEPDAVFLEVGPGGTLGSLLRRQPGFVPGRAAIASLPGPGSAEPADAHLLRAAARLWLAGARLDAKGFYAGQRRRRARLPTTPFDLTPFWVEPVGAGAAVGGGARASALPEAESAPLLATPAARPGLATPYQAPATELEAALAAIWSGLLGVQPVGVHDDFFELGGHSLLATQVLSRLRDEQGREVPLAWMMEHPTIAALAARLEAAGEALLPPLLPADRAQPLPLSFVQERFYFLDQLAPGDPAYNIPFALSLSGPLDARALAAAFAEIERRHEALRTIFDASGDRPVQCVLPPRPALPVVDLGTLAASARQRVLRGLVQANAVAPFWLERGPLYRARLLRLGGEEAVLLVAFHHAIADGWSFAVLTRELSALYAAERTGRPSPLPELKVQIGDHARWQRQWLSGEVLGAQLEHWRRALAEPAPPLPLPTLPRQEPAGSRGLVRTFEIEAGLEAALERLGRAHRATPFMTLLGAFAALLASYSEVRDLLIGSPIAGRRQRDTEALIGCFINTLVLRQDLGGDPTFEEILARTRATTLGAYANQDLPYERLISELRLERDQAPGSLFRVWFVVQNAPPEVLELPGLAADLIRPEAVAVRHDLKLDLTPTGRGIHAFFEARAELFDAAILERMSARFLHLLRRVVAAPERRLSTLVAELAAGEEQSAAERRVEARSAALDRLQKARRAVAPSPELNPQGARE